MTQTLVVLRQDSLEPQLRQRQGADGARLQRQAALALTPRKQQADEALSESWLATKLEQREGLIHYEQLISKR